MKYFYVSSPYFALIKANTETEAINKYTEEVADNLNNEVNENIKEVSRDHALINFAYCAAKAGLSSTEVLKEFEDEELSVLGVDANLC